MIDWPRLKPTLAKICESLKLMIFGAVLLALYLSDTNPADAWLGRNIWPIFLLPFWTLHVLATWLRPEKLSGEVSVTDLAPKWSGIAVVLATGLTAAFAYSLGVAGSRTLTGAIAIVVVTILVATLIWRFASSHADEIGEARFPSTSTD